MTSAISIKGLKKTYAPTKSGNVKSPATVALKGIDLEIKKGEFFGLLGPNGAGKTTLINILCDLTNKTEGSIEIFGKDVDKHRTEVKNHLGLSPQDYNFDTWLNVEQTLIYHAAYRGVKKKEREERAEILLKRFGLLDKQKADIRFLSGGMKRKLVLARALMHRPDIIILDEPTAALDVEVRHELWEYIRDLNKKGTTVILTTHYIEEAEALCDRVAIINKGQIIADDTPKNLMKKSKAKKLEHVFLQLTKLKEDTTL